MADDGFGKKRNVDFVFCIDGTGSMAPCIESVKRNAHKFHRDFVRAMTDADSDVDSVRIKIIVFRDYHDDGNKAMCISPFFELPSDNADFDKYLSEITADGGGDSPENGLEALYFAMKSDFTTGADDRQVIVLFTDADALPLRARACEKNYPDEIPDEDGLVRLWSCCVQDKDFKLRERNKRLVMFAPSGSKYKELEPKLNRCVFCPVDMKKGMGNIDFRKVAETVTAFAGSNE